MARIRASPFRLKEFTTIETWRSPLIIDKGWGSFRRARGDGSWGSAADFRADEPTPPAEILPHAYFDWQTKKPVGRDFLANEKGRPKIQTRNRKNQRGVR